MRPDASRTICFICFLEIVINLPDSFAGIFEASFEFAHGAFGKRRSIDDDRIIVLIARDGTGKHDRLCHCRVSLTCELFQTGCFSTIRTSDPPSGASVYPTTVRLSGSSASKPRHETS